MGIFNFILKSLKHLIKSDSKELPAENSHYERIIEKINNSELIPDEKGLVKLPAELAQTVEGSRVLVGENSRAEKIIIFPTWRGKGFNLKGYLFVKGDLIETDTFTDYYGNKSIKIGNIEYVVEARVSKDWYKVSRSLD
jgi:hypothetical protein